MDNPLSPAFFIGTIHIGQIEGASCFNLGNNWPTNFRSYKKQNQGFGTVRGNQNSVTGSKSLLNDPDIVDAPNFTDKEPPTWLKQMLNQAQTADYFNAMTDSETDADSGEEQEDEAGEGVGSDNEGAEDT